MLTFTQLKMDTHCAAKEKAKLKNKLHVFKKHFHIFTEEFKQKSLWRARENEHSKGPCVLGHGPRGARSAHVAFGPKCCQAEGLAQGPCGPFSLISTAMVFVRVRTYMLRTTYTLHI